MLKWPQSVFHNFHLKHDIAFQEVYENFDKSSVSHYIHTQGVDMEVEII